MIAHQLTTSDIQSLPEGVTLLRLPSVLKMVPLSASSIRKKEAKGEFPAGFALTPRCKVWRDDHIKGWIAERFAAQEPCKGPKV